MQPLFYPITIVIVQILHNNNKSLFFLILCCRTLRIQLWNVATVAWINHLKPLRDDTFSKYTRTHRKQGVALCHPTSCARGQRRPATSALSSFLPHTHRGLAATQLSAAALLLSAHFEPVCFLTYNGFSHDGMLGYFHMAAERTQQLG